MAVDFHSFEAERLTELTKEADQAEVHPPRLDLPSRPPQSERQPADRGFSVGFVELEELDEQGNLLHSYALLNTLTYSYRDQQAAWLAGSTTAAVPSHIALGTTYAASNVNQKTVTQMVHEVIRKSCEERAAISNGARFRATFKGTDVAMNIAELMLFSGTEFRSALDNCNTSTNWSTGASQTLTTDASELREGTASLTISTIAGGPSDRTFYSTRIGANLPSTTVGVNASSALDFLQLWLFVSTASAVNQLLFNISSSPTDSTDQWQFTYNPANLLNGWNYVDLPFSSAAVTGSPDSSTIKRFEMVCNKTHPTTMKLDRIRTFKQSGTAIARTELSPYFSKGIASILNISWTILPDYESRANAGFWDGLSSSAIINDVTQNLTQTGVGTFPTVTSHPWTYGQMWLPAASGYMTGGLKALSSQAGAVAMWVRYPPSGSSPASCTLFDWRTDANNHITIGRDAGDANFIFEYSNGGLGVHTAIVANALSANGYRFLVAQWDSTEMRLYVEGSSNTNAVTLSSGNLMTSQLVQPTLGGGSGLTTTSCKIGPVLYFNRALSTTEVQNLYVLGRKFAYKEM